MGYQFKPRYIVICREDAECGDEKVKGVYTLATRGYWTNQALAQKYADGIAPSREPLVVRSDTPLEFYDREVFLPQTKSKRT